MPVEQWGPVEGGRYLISSLGRVSNARTGYILKPWVNQDGYEQIGLHQAGGKNRQYLVHRLVALAFIPNPDGLPLVLHGVNGIRDNSVSNLRWGTNSDNMRDRRRDGTDFNTRKTHCPKGHPYDESNTYRPAIRQGQSRQCKTCNRARREEARLKGLPDGDHRHGTMNGYVTYGCRCGDCVTENRAWRREYMKEYRERSKTSQAE